MTLSIVENKYQIEKNANDLQRAWEGVKRAKPSTRIREAAEMLNVSEAELRATRVDKDCIRLSGNWNQFVYRLIELGKVMALTRNGNCVLEHKGHFKKINIFGSLKHQVATVEGPIEARYFLHNWHVGFAVKEHKKDRWLTSIQIFDHQGNAITKIYLQRQSNWKAYENLVKDFKAHDQSKSQTIAYTNKENYQSEIDKTLLLSDWAQLKDTHDFFPLLRKHNITRLKAMELAQGVYTHSFNPAEITDLLKTCSEIKLPIMVFAGNEGAIQIHQNKIKKVHLLNMDKPGKKECWINIMDPLFNMHLRLSEISSAWIVRKPIKDGPITSLEFYDNTDELVVQFFGLRKNHEPENKTWTQLTKSILNCLSVN